MAYGKGKVSSDAMNQHRSMAGAGMKGSFGVGPLPQRDKQHPDVGMSHAPLEDAKRGAPMGISGKDANMQASPDHGPMGNDHFVRGAKV